MDAHNTEHKNILYISARSDRGGGPWHMIHLMKQLAKSGNFRFFLACPDRGELFPKMAEFAQECFYLPERSFKLKAFWQLKQFCQQNSIQLVHSHGRGAGIYSRLLALFGFKVVHTFHGATVPAGFKGELRLWADQILRFFMKKAICVSKDEAQYVVVYSMASPKQIEIIPNSINWEDFKSARSDVRKPITVLGVMARYDHAKGLDLLISHFANFEQNNPGIPLKLRIAGGGDEMLKHRYQSLADRLEIASQIEFLGECANPVEFYSTIDLYVSASRSEGLPLTVLEAWAAGKPTLLSNVTGHRFLGESDASWLYRLDSSADFSLNLAAILADPEERDRRCIRALQRLKNEFSIEQMAAQTAKVYQQVFDS